MPASRRQRAADADGRQFDSTGNKPLPVLQADRTAIRDVMLKAFAGRPEGAAIVPFPAFARAIHVFVDYEKALGTRSLNEEEIDGLGLAGPSSWVKSLTGALKLLRRIQPWPCATRDEQRSRARANRQAASARLTARELEAREAAGSLISGTAG